MADSVNKILWKFFGDTKNLDKSLSKTQASFKRTTKASDSMQAGLGMATRAAGALGLALGGREILNWAGDAIQMAVAAEEVDSKFRAVFGSAEKFTEKLSEWADMAGVTDTAAKDLAATFGNLVSAQGLSELETEKMSLAVATLAGDMASFNDSDPALVFQELGQAIATTERDALKKYGIAVTETEVKQRALTIAMADGRDEIKASDRATASYEIIVGQAGKAVGDLERTEKSTANQQRQLTAEIQETKEAIGKALLPAMSAAVKGMNSYITEIQDMTEETADWGDVAQIAAKAGWDFYSSVTPLAKGFDYVADKVREGLDGMSEFDWMQKDLIAQQQARADALKRAWNTALALPYSEYANGMRLWGDSMLATAAAAGEIVVELYKIKDLSGHFASVREDTEWLLAQKGIAPGTGGISGPQIGFAQGGVVPGAPGAPVNAMVHGGEVVLNREQQKAVGGGGGVTVVLNGFVGDPVALSQQLNDLLELGGRNGG